MTQKAMPDKPTRIKPRLLKGFQDIMPDAMLARRKLIDTVRAVYERYGFAPLDTPAMEYLETLTGEYGKESSKEIYDFTDRAGDQVALRYDLTVPLARLVALYPDLPRPFRRYQIAPVWRFDKPGPGRFREFLRLFRPLSRRCSPWAWNDFMFVSPTAKFLMHCLTSPASHPSTAPVFSACSTNWIRPDGTMSCWS